MMHSANPNRSAADSRRASNASFDQVGVGLKQSLVAAVIIGVSVMAFSPAAIAQASGVDVLNRVLSAGKIRCGYISYAPYTIKDPNSNALRGISVEAIEAIGHNLDLQIEWTAEAGYGSFVEDLNANRYDALCSGVWQNSTRGKRVFFTTPLLFNPIYVWVRTAETRFKSLDDLNSASVRIAVQDGAIDNVIAQTNFPAARRVAIPQLSQWTDNLLNLIDNKADVVFSEPSVITPFMEKNPGKVKELVTPQPIRVFGITVPIKMGEINFKSMLDSAINEILLDGTMENILRKYDTVPGELLRVAPPYETSKH